MLLWQCKYKPLYLRNTMPRNTYYIHQRVGVLQDNLSRHHTSELYTQNMNADNVHFNDL